MATNKPGWSTGGKLGDHYFTAEGAAICNRTLKPSFIYNPSDKMPERACKRCQAKVAKLPPAEEAPPVPLDEAKMMARARRKRVQSLVAEHRELKRPAALSSQKFLPE